MDNEPIQIGDCFLFDNDEGGQHMHIVLAEDRENPYGHIMLVYITSSERIFDTTTIFEPGSHEFINRKSWVKYDNVQIILRAEIRQRIIKRYKPLNDEQIKKVQSGILLSKRTPRRIKDLYIEWNSERLLRNINNSG